MHEKAPATTINGHEISSTREKLSPNEFREMLSIYGLDGNNPEERVEALKGMSAEKIAMLLTDINRRVQGSDDTLMSSKTMKVGDKSVVPAEDRYYLFLHLIKKIGETPADINPERIGDALSVGIVVLHPFKDGNGRTSRVLRLAFDPSYDTSDYENNFNFLASPKNPNNSVSFIPNFKDLDQSDPRVVEDYFDRLLSEEDDRLYLGLGGKSYAKLKKNTSYA